MPKKKINRPNLSLYDIQTRDDDYAKHNRCGGLIAHARDKRTLRCLSCEQKVGKKGSAMIREQASPMLEHIDGVGVMGVYFCPPPPTKQETTDNACTRVIEELRVEVAGSQWAVESRMFRQQYDTEVPGPRPKKVLPSAEPPTMEGFSEGVKTGRLASYGTKAGARARATAKRIRNIEGRKKKKSSSQWDRTSKAAGMGREAARGRAEQMLASGQDRSGPYLNQPRPQPLPEQALEELAAGKGLHPHFERLSRARPIRRARPTDESLLARVQALEPRDRGGYMNQTLTEPALDAAAEEARRVLAGRQRLDNAIAIEDKEAPFDHKKAMRDYVEKKRFDSGYVNAQLAKAEKRAEFVSLAEKKRHYKEN